LFFFWGVNTLEHCLEQLEQFRTTKKIGLFEKWGPLQKTVFLFFPPCFLFFWTIFLEQFRTNLEQSGTTKKILKIKNGGLSSYRWLGAEFVRWKTKQRKDVYRGKRIKALQVENQMSSVWSSLWAIKYNVINVLVRISTVTGSRTYDIFSVKTGI